MCIKEKTSILHQGVQKLLKGIQIQIKKPDETHTHHHLRLRTENSLLFPSVWENNCSFCTGYSICFGPHLNLTVHWDGCVGWNKKKKKALWGWEVFLFSLILSLNSITFQWERISPSQQGDLFSFSFLPSFSLIVLIGAKGAHGYRQQIQNCWMSVASFWDSESQSSACVHFNIVPYDHFASVMLSTLQKKLATEARMQPQRRWHLLGFGVCAVLLVWAANTQTPQNLGWMCQMTCCIGLHKMKYAAVLAKGEALEKRFWC